jgi:hypothetical protein
MRHELISVLRLVRLDTAAPIMVPAAASATSLAPNKPPVSQEQRDSWLGHNDQRTARWYEHHDPEFLEDARRATDSIIEELQRYTTRPLSARELRAKASIHLVSGKVGSHYLPGILADNGGRDRDRTCDPYHVKVVLSR